MSLHSVFLWFYCLDYHEVIILLGLATGLFFIIRTRFGHRKFWKSALLALLIGWASVVIAQTLLWRTSDTALEPIWHPFQSYLDALGGETELLRSNFMNVVLFYPAGLLAASILPTQYKPIVKLFAMLAVFTVFSTAIEYLQYRYCLGLAQTDDIIHNVLGALLGAAVPIIAGLFQDNPQT